MQAGSDPALQAAAALADDWKYVPLKVGEGFATLNLPSGSVDLTFSASTANLAIDRIVLTASGGPFRGRRDLDDATPDALLTMEPHRRATVRIDHEQVARVRSDVDDRPVGALFAAVFRTPSRLAAHAAPLRRASLGTRLCARAPPRPDSEGLVMK